ncbi:MAG: hypothetical protein L0Y64_17090, partial [Myxococcaceae bacterium]|nr:hypothetical protein [Myxococcaceae bacterium]
MKRGVLLALLVLGGGHLLTACRRDPPANPPANTTDVNCCNATPSPDAPGHGDPGVDPQPPPPGAPERCGDGVAHPPEVCDDGNTLDGDRCSADCGLVRDAPHPAGLELIYAFLDRGDLASANLILEDRWPVPRSSPVTLRSPLTWTEDPYDDSYWRFVFYSLRPTAHLLWAFRETGDVRYRDKLMQVVSAFARDGQNGPYSSDKHGTAYRAMVLVNTYWKLKMAQALSADEEQTLLALLTTTGAFLEDPLNFEEEYNHGFAEAAALWLIAECFPTWPQSPRWRVLAAERIGSLLANAVAEDGVATENSVYYHFYILTQLWQMVDWSNRHGIARSLRMEDTARQMIRFGTHIIQP